MKLIISPRAERDLSAIADYIARENPAAARRTILRIRDQLKYLLRHPYIGPSREHIRPSLRCLPVDNFVLYYMPSDSKITLIRVMRGAQDVPETL